MAEKWYFIGTIRLYSTTYDVIQLFGVYFIREHYQQFSWVTGREYKRTWLEIESGSIINHVIETKFGEPDVFGLLAGIQISQAMNDTKVS